MTTQLFLTRWPALTILCCAMTLTSCYHWGALDNKQGQAIAIDSVRNDTNEGALAATMRQKLQEHLSNQPGFANCSQTDKSDFFVKVRLVDIRNLGVARSEVRDKKAREDDGNAYQTVLYRIELKTTYELYRSNAPDKPILSRDITGMADLPRMHDRNIPLQAACRQAADDAARKIVADILDQEWPLPVD